MVLRLKLSATKIKVINSVNNSNSGRKVEGRGIIECESKIKEKGVLKA